MGCVNSQTVPNKSDVSLGLSKSQDKTFSNSIPNAQDKSSTAENDVLNKDRENPSTNITASNSKNMNGENTFATRSQMKSSEYNESRNLTNSMAPRTRVEHSMIETPPAEKPSTTQDDWTDESKEVSSV